MSRGRPDLAAGGRKASLPILCALLALVAACGGSDDSKSPAAEVESPAATVDTSAEETESLPGWVEARLAGKEGEDVALVFGTSDHAVGRTRVSFLVVRSNGQLVQEAEAKVYFAPADAQSPLEADAELEPLSLEPGTGEFDTGGDVPNLYVTRLDLPETGRYWLVVEPAGQSIQAAGVVEVQATTISPAVGSRAVASDTPTLDDAPAEEITTANPPDVELLRYSIADSLAAKAPFVVVFATPKFCQSRTCGPIVDAVDALGRKFEDEGIRFIHVEVYKNNDPQQGVNRWMQEWDLPTEPWVFLVDSAGVIRAKFEGSASLAELETAVREHLL